MIKNKGYQRTTDLAPIIKWPGGKEKELKYIIPNLPVFDRYFEPFVGGGSVFMCIEAKEYKINDLSNELIQLYQYIKTKNKLFFSYVESIDNSWKAIDGFSCNNSYLQEIYIDYRKDKIDKDGLKRNIESFCKSKKQEIVSILTGRMSNLPHIFYQETEKNLLRKMQRMKELEVAKHTLPLQDVQDNIETAIKSALYMDYRHLYNNKDIEKNNPVLHGALFFFIRNYAYSGMFRYSKQGLFNVPYGGMAYNRKQLEKKLHYYVTEKLQNHFKKATFFNEDFETFLVKEKPTESDFVFFRPTI